MKKIAINLPEKFAFYPTKLTPRKDLLGLIRQMHPLTTQHPLIRLGAAGDGGYLVPDDLEGIEALFSPGVDFNSAFEVDCANRGMKVFMADASVAGPAATHPSFHFLKKFLGSFTDGDFTSMEDWVEASGLPPSSDLMLQMDIEGYEYETLFSMPTALMRRFRIIVLELHKLENLYSAAFWPVLSRCLSKLLHTHACVHIHPNNMAPSVKRGDIEIPWFCEFTFYRRDRITRSGFATTFPHPLDADCTDAEPPHPLPKTWFRQVAENSHPI
jgi:hypothetical protein